MKDNPQSEPTSGEIKHLLQEAILRNFPNPERRGCSDQQTLKDVAARRLPHEHPQWQYITHCSPCYQEFLQYRANLLEGRRSRRRFAAVAGTIGAAALIAVIWLSTMRSAPKVPPNAVNHLPAGNATAPQARQALTAVLKLQASLPRAVLGGPPLNRATSSDFPEVGWHRS